MPGDNLLAQFDALGEADDHARCNAALRVREILAKPDLETVDEERNYSVKRLVRGMQSSRRCCRLGFSTALAELLLEFPHRLQDVLVQIKTELALAASLKPGESKERMFGQLFVLAAALEARSFETEKCLASLDHKRNPLLELGRSLFKVYEANTPAQSLACKVLVDICRQLCRGKQHAQVAEMISPWKLEEKAAEEQPDAFCIALIIELRFLFDEQVLAGHKKDEMRLWPACTRKDTLSKAPQPRAHALVASFGTELAQASVGAKLWLTQPFCVWFLIWCGQQDASQRRKLFKAIETSMLKDSHPAHSLYAFGQFVVGLGNARNHPAIVRNPLDAEVMDSILLTLFTSMWKMMETLCNAASKADGKANPSAVFAQQCLLNLLGTSELPTAPKKGKAAAAHAAAETAPRIVPWPMSDSLRLAIVTELQKHTKFSAMRSTYIHQWHQALLMPLSVGGVREHCAKLFKELHELVSSGCTPEHFAAVKARVTNLHQLSSRVRSPDDVTLAVACAVFSFAYFEPADASQGAQSTAFRDFRQAAQIAEPPDGGLECDIPVPRVSGKGSDVAQFKGWEEQLFWSTLSSLLRRSPNYVEQPNEAGTSGEKPDNATTEVSTVFKTFAYHGRLADQSLWIMRLHEWWDYLSSCGAGSKKRNGKTSGGTFRCTVELTEEANALRARCLEVCRKVLKKDKNESVLRQPRQRNALCSFPLCLAMGLLASPSDEEAMAIKEQLEEILKVLEVVARAKPLEPPATATDRMAQVPQEAKSSLAVAVRVAAEAYTESSGFVSQAALTLWRELGDFASDETLATLSDFASGSGKAAEDGGNNDEEDDDSEDDEEDDDDEEQENAAEGKAADDEKKNAGEDDEDEEEDEDEDAAKEPAAKKQKTKEKDAKEDDESEDDNEYEVLGGDDLLSALLGDDQVDGAASNPLLRSFAGQALSGKNVLKPKKSKRQMRAQQLQEQVSRQVRELELLDIFLQRFADKRAVAAQVIQQVYAAMLYAGRAPRSNKVKNRQGRSDAAVRRIQQEFSRNCGKALAKAMKRMSRQEGLQLVSSWHSPSKWEEVTRAHWALASKGAADVASKNTAPAVGGQLLYWFCAAHSVATMREGGADVANLSPAARATSPLTAELLEQALQEWSTEKSKDGFCLAVLSAFAARCPKPLLRLPWIETIRNSRNLFAQRAEVSFITSYVLRNWENMTDDDKQTMSVLAKELAGLCAELLEASLDSESAGESATQPSGNQQQKLRRDILKGLCQLLRGDGKRWPRAINTSKLRTKISKAVIRVVDALPVKRHTVYQLCLQLQRSIKKAAEEVQGLKSPSLVPHQSPRLMARGIKGSNKASPSLGPQKRPSQEPKATSSPAAEEEPDARQRRLGKRVKK